MNANAISVSTQSAHSSIFCELKNLGIIRENLYDLSRLVVEKNADLGIVVDPDVDRLAFVSENGEVFGEEYTIVACADYYLKLNPGNTVSNLSSSRALKDISEFSGCEHIFSPVGEVNVVKLMREKNAVFLMSFTSPKSTSAGPKRVPLAGRFSGIVLG